MGQRAGVALFVQGQMMAPPRELNPNHPVANEMREQWHKLLAITMWKYDVDRLVITSDEIDRFMADHPDGCKCRR
jgi:hypothetical protein